MTRPGMAQMGSPDSRAKAFGPSLKRLLRELVPEKPIMALVVGLGVVGVVLSTLGPWILGKATNYIFDGVIGKTLHGQTKAEAIEDLRKSGHGQIADMVSGMNVTPGAGIDFEAVGHIMLLTLAVYVGASLCMWLQAWLLTGVIQRTVRRMRADVEEKIHSLPLSYFDSAPRGDLLSRVTNDVDNIAQSLQQTVSQLMTSLFTVVGILIMMIWISPLLALISVITVPIAVVLTAKIAQRSRPHFADQWKYTGMVNAQVEDAFTGHELVVAFGRSDHMRAEFTDRNAQLYESSYRAQFISGIVMPAMMFLGNLNYVVTAVVGGLKVASGQLTLGEVQAFIQYSRQFTQPMTQIAAMMNLLQSGVASAERVFELLDAPDQEPDPVQSTKNGPQLGRVEFVDVSFRYNPDVPLISRLSLVADPGHVVAIVGPTGAGKTTLVNLLMRFYDLDSGYITIDGTDIASMPRGQVRGQIGMVLQDTWLFGGTIRENIAYGNPNATDEQILAAARAAYVDRFVHVLPNGYDTVLDDEGAGVSAGEKQLITIARAFLADPAILILDEATSSVDTRTEALVQHATAALRTDRTSFVIAHRLSTIRDADSILVMENGNIVEQGTHDTLLARDGAYARLYRSQFEGAVV